MLIAFKRVFSCMSQGMAFTQREATYASRRLISQPGLRERLILSPTPTPSEAFGLLLDRYLNNAVCHFSLVFFAKTTGKKAG